MSAGKPTAEDLPILAQLNVDDARATASISAVVKAVAPKPVSVLAGPADAVTLAELRTIGVRRISLGSTPTPMPSRRLRRLRRGPRREP